jgi:hypothetical protein
MGVLRRMRVRSVVNVGRYCKRIERIQCRLFTQFGKDSIQAGAKS